jgi:hypothetical protein
MFDIEKFYEQAEQGEAVDETGFIESLKAYKNIIIWGAGNLGTALGKDLLQKEVSITAYWDARYQTLGTCNGIQVLENFQGNFVPSETLIIIGIVNGTLSHKWQSNQLVQHHYNNFLFGMRVYEGIACPMKVGEKLEANYCTSTSICNFNTCKKYMSILKNECKKEDIISVQVMEFILSRRCTLDCLYCGQQEGLIRRKFPEKYHDYPLERIKRDIDICMENIDVVGTFSIIGGEPFIHPNLAEIIEHCLSKNNVAIISITTNGICNMSEDTLRRIRSNRVKINFSNYTQSLSEQHKQLFSENVNKVKKMGVNCNISTPVWSSVSDKLVDEPNQSAEYLSEVKSSCVMGPSVANGIFFACPTIETYSKTESFPVDNQFIELDKCKNIREQMRELINRPYYCSCGYRCGNGIGSCEVMPGVQY